MLVFYFALFFSVSVNVYAENSKELFDKATKSYDQGQFDDAIASLEQILVTDPRQSDVYFNLGNAYFRANKLGNSIAAYLKARSLNPIDPDIKLNLHYALNQITDKIEPSKPATFLSHLVFWKDYVSIDSLCFLSLICFCLGSLFLLLSMLSAKLSSFKIQSLFFFVPGFFLLLLYGVSKSLESPFGSIVTEVTSVRSGPSESNTEIFVLHQGSPFSLEEESDLWCKILLSDGKKGWAKKSDLKVY